MMNNFFITITGKLSRGGRFVPTGWAFFPYMGQDATLGVKILMFYFYDITCFAKKIPAYR